MTPCRACAQPVANDAKVCPHCGASEPTLNAAGRTLVGVARFVGFAVIVLVVLVILGNLLN